MTRVSVLEPRRAEVGGFEVGRVLPQRARRMVGPWCFVDRMGPAHLDGTSGLDVGPHPHIGLQTVTWLLEGRLLHTDSLGTEQIIEPGQLNLMTAGHGVSHAEQSSGVADTGQLFGVQLWVAQPATTRHGAPAFEHHRDLEVVEFDHARATVIIGEFAGATSPARCDTDHVAVEIDLDAGVTELPCTVGHDYAVLALGEPVVVVGHVLERGELGVVESGVVESGVVESGGATGAIGDEVSVTIEAHESSRVLLIGGAPFDDEVLMWWNYVARTRTEIVEAHRQWSDGHERFGTVPIALERIDVPGPPWS